MTDEDAAGDTSGPVSTEEGATGPESDATDSAATGSQVEPDEAPVAPSTVPEIDESALDTDREPEELVGAVADVEDGAAEGVAALVHRIAELEAERTDLEEELESVQSQLKRKQADFQNYKKRAKRKQERVKEQAAADLIERLLAVRDDLARALDDAAADDGDTLQEGVRMTLSEFDRILDAEGVDRIEVEPGDPVDPEHHEVIARVDGDTEPGTIDEQHRPGYRMAGSVLREAQVTVTDEDE